MQNKKNDLIAKVKEKVVLYGYFQTFVIIIKSLLKKALSVSYDRYYLMAQDIDESDICFDTDSDIRKLTIEDYDNSLWEPFFMEGNKKQLYRSRFDNPYADAYGAFIGEDLACSGWILYDTVMVRDRFFFKSDRHIGLLFDDYCHPKYRGRGLYKSITKYRLAEMAKNGISKVYVIVLTYNRASINTHTKCGFRVEKKFHIVTFRNKSYCSLKMI